MCAVCVCSVQLKWSRLHSVKHFIKHYAFKRECVGSVYVFHAFFFFSCVQFLESDPGAASVCTMDCPAAEGDPEASGSPSIKLK